MRLAERPFGSELVAAMEAADAAAELVMQMRFTASSSFKADGSIVTDADLAAAQVIRSRLATLFPDDVILTEEDADDLVRLDHQRCWLVDPIDGTQQYADGESEFDVYVALSLNGKIVAGVSVQPATGLAIAASAGGGAWVRKIGDWAALRFDQATRSPILATRPWLGSPGNLPALQRAAEKTGGIVRDPGKSISIRTFLPGPESIDAAIAFYRDGSEPGSYEWDFAVLDIVLREAGGASSGLDGLPITFNKADPRFPDGLILARSVDLAEQMRLALAG